MSQVLSKSPKHCGEKRKLNIDKHYKKLFCVLSTFFTSVLSLILLIWLILHPSKPQFSLREADVYLLNLSSAHLLNSSIQLTLLSNNPNQKVGIYYDELQVYAAYKGQQITADSYLPPFYQGHQDTNLLTASLVGTGLPVAASFGYEVGRDQTAGKLVLNLKMNGKLRWKSPGRSYPLKSFESRLEDCVHRPSVCRPAVPNVIDEAHGRIVGVVVVPIQRPNGGKKVKKRLNYFVFLCIRFLM